MNRTTVMDRSPNRPVEVHLWILDEYRRANTVGHSMMQCNL
uniref:Uncharacterized protein n=1 Tax=Rhizophora mucronata TaxID=61149 RepID=A0A2P2P6F7_RHIMU